MGHSSYITCCTVHGSYIITASADGTMKKWNIADASCSFTFHGHTARVNRSAFLLTRYLTFYPFNVAGTAYGMASVDGPLGNASPNGIPGGYRTRVLHVSSRARLHVATTAYLTRYFKVSQPIPCGSPILKRIFDRSCSSLVEVRTSSVRGI